MVRRFFLFLLLIVLLQLPQAKIFSQEPEEIEEINALGRNYAGQGNFAAAEEAFTSIFAIDSNSISARNNLGVLYKLLGRYNDALRVLKEAEAIVKHDCGSTCPQLGNIYMNIGVIYNQKQDYELALQYFRQSEYIFEVNDTVSSQTIKVYNNIGNAYFGMNDFRKALDSYKEGIEVKKTINAGGFDVPYANCASSYENLGRFDSASIYYNLSIEAKIASSGKRNYKLIATYNNYAVLLQKMGQYEKAYEYLRKALDLATELLPEKHQLTAACYEKVGSWYLASGDPENALEYFNLGINADVFDFSITDGFLNPDLSNEILSEPVLLDLLIGKASALGSMHNRTDSIHFLLASLETLEFANMLTEKMRSSYMGEESKLLITGNARSGFDRNIQTAYKLYLKTGDEQYANKAFIAAEKSKSSVLLASLQEVERKKNLAIPTDLQVLEQDMKWETDVYKKRIYEELQRPDPDENKLSNWQDRLFYLSRQLDSLDQLVKHRFPEYASKFDNEVIELRGAMAELDEKQVLLEYSLSDSSLFIFLVSSDGFLIEKMDIDQEFHKNVGILSQFLRNNDFANNTYDEYWQYCTSSYSLYSKFIAPLEDHLANKKLLIIPDGELGYIPFEALLTDLPEEGSMDYRNLPYLLYKYPTNYSYSATLFFSESGEQPEAENQVLAFAPTYENMGEISEEKFPNFRDYSTQLVPLRFIATEIQNISEIIECDTYEGFDATEEVFKQKAPSYNILHLAMHTLIDDDNPLYSRLVFTLNNDIVEENDGLLNAYEIFNMELNARMAVLSACNTGSGILQKGEGIMSMARGFIFAGVPSIIMTLWAVEDQAGSIMMSKFYKNLVEGMEIDEALRQAKLQYLAEADQLSAHPYLWSGYVGIGSTDAVVSNTSAGIYGISGGAVLVIMLVLIVLLRRKRKKKA